MISFKTTKEDKQIILRIAERAHKFYPEIDKLHFVMDVTAVHANGCPLDLERFETADDFNFKHDIAGIYRHLDRDDNSPTGGQLLNWFLPRFAKIQRA